MRKDVSTTFLIAKFFAIITVISAHINIKTSSVISNLYGVIGSIGVIVFFLISGYYFKKEKPLVLLKKKLKSIVLPWILLGSLVYVINTILNDYNFNVISYIEWMFGYKTYLYYVVIILLCFIIFIIAILSL